MQTTSKFSIVINSNLIVPVRLATIKRLPEERIKGRFHEKAVAYITWSDGEREREGFLPLDSGYEVRLGDTEYPMLVTIKYGGVHALRIKDKLCILDRGPKERPSTWCFGPAYNAVFLAIAERARAKSAAADSQSPVLADLIPAPVPTATKEVAPIQSASSPSPAEIVSPTGGDPDLDQVLADCQLRNGGKKNRAFGPDSRRGSWHSRRKRLHRED